MTKIDYEKVVTQWREFELPIVKPRDVAISLSSNFIWSIVGPRRAGKTYVCFQLMRQLLEQGVNRDNLFYVNFEDERLIGANAADLSKLLETLYELYAPDKNNFVYLFLDEIQNVDQWQSWVRRIFETEKKIKIVVTGSSAKLLSKELTTKLRGRVLPCEIFPLNFREYLKWNGVNYNIKTISHSQQNVLVKKHFFVYLQNGGYPALMEEPASLRDNILQQYFDSMILNDIVERHNVESVKKIKILASLLFASTAKEISYNKLANKLSAIGFAISKSSVIDYISYFEDAYLFFQNLKYEYSFAKQLGAIKKIYCVDNGLLNAVSFKFSEDEGRLLENLVFLELRRRQREVYYHRRFFECDFLLKHKNKVISAFQVATQLNEDNTQREIDGLVETMAAYKLSEGYILTKDQDDQLAVKGKKIFVLPVWKWLLRE